MTTKPRAAIYIRVSSRPQEEGHSLDTQEADCRAYAASKGYHVVGVYREIFTGVELDARPELRRLRADIEAGRVQVVVVWHSDRLSRDPDDRVILRSEARVYGARYESVKDPSGDTREDQLVDYIRGYAARLEYDRIKERSVANSRARANKGQLWGGTKPRYGYQYDDPSPKAKTRYVEDPATSWVVRLIFEKIAEGMPKRTLCRELDERGIPTAQGGKQWRPFALQTMIRSPFYRGEAASYVTKLVKDENGKAKRIRRESAEGDDGFVPLPAGVVPALVSDDLWHRANAALDRADRHIGTRYAPGEDPEDVLVRGHVKCQCGYSMVIKRYASGPFLYCQARDRKANRPCTGNLIKAETLDEAVWNRIRWILTEPDVLVREIERQRDAGTVVVDETTMDGPIRSVETRIANTTDNLTRVSGPAADTLLAKLEALTAERDKLIARRAELKAQREAIEGQNVAIRDWLEELTEAAADVDRLDFRGKRERLDALGVAVTVNYKQSDKARYEISVELPVGIETPMPWERQAPTIYRVGRDETASRARPACTATPARGSRWRS